MYRSCLAAFWCLREHLLAEGLQGVSSILQDPSKLVTTANFEAAYSRFVAIDYQVLSRALHQVDQTVLLFELDSLQMHFESSRPTRVVCTKFAHYDLTRTIRLRQAQIMTRIHSYALEQQSISKRLLQGCAAANSPHPVNHCGHDTFPVDVNICCGRLLDACSKWNCATCRSH